MTKVLLDTDIGSDIDDAVCLAYLLANPECDLLGITTVSGEAVKRASMASALCEVAGKEVPIYPGVEKPLLVKQQQIAADQAVKLAKWGHKTEFPQGEAITFMRDTIRQNPGEVVLLTIGPLTNAALLFAMDPEISSLLKGFVLMCGKFMMQMADDEPHHWAEWNALVDPHATAVVYDHPAKVHRSIGLDVTTQVVMPADEVRSRFEAPLLRPVLDFAEVWFESREMITFHDPLAATTIFDDGICRFEKGDVSVELTDPSQVGATHWNTKVEHPRHEVAEAVDVDRFFTHFFGMF